jgi:8-oxo-dGTP pyrophosphatase MutT (NUDIX family)
MVTVFVARPDESGSSHEFLQLRRVLRDYMGGTWQTVRGVAEPGESAPAAALRELREEAGLTPREFYGLSSIDSFYTAKFDTIWHCAVFFALIGRDAKVVRNHEHDDHRWVRLDRVDECFMWPRERELIAEIVREIFGEGLEKPHLIIKL